MDEKMKKKKRKGLKFQKRKEKHLATLDWCQTCFLDLKN
jgi:hypothetical protein